MKCDGIKFVYRGTDPMGRILAHMLEEMSVEYTVGSPSVIDTTDVSADLGALLRTFDERVLRRTAPVKAQPMIQTAVPVVPVRDSFIIAFLQSMNVPIGKPVTIRFDDDRTPSRFDRDPDATEMRRRGASVFGGTPDHRGTGC